MLPERERQKSHRRKGVGRRGCGRRQERSKMLLKSIEGSDVLTVFSLGLVAAG